MTKSVSQASSKIDMQEEDFGMPDEEIVPPSANSFAPIEASTLPPSDLPSFTPSWFSANYPGATPEELAGRYRAEQRAVPLQSFQPTNPEAYEAYRRRLEERFQLAQRLADPAHAPATFHTGQSPYLATPLHTSAPAPGNSFPQRKTRASQQLAQAQPHYRLRWPPNNRHFRRRRRP